MKILIVSGFLGAGKTTFIKELARRTSEKLVVFENEYGQVGIDGDRLKSQKMDVWEMAEGCICCSMKGDFTASVLTIANVLNPDCLVVEPTGLGLLSSILENLSKIEYERISLLAPVALVDVGAYETSIREFGDYYRDQIKNASQILLTKSINSEENVALTAQLRSLNAKAPIVADYRTSDDQWWSDVMNRRWNETVKALPPQSANRLELEHLALTDVFATSLEELASWINGLLSGRFGFVFRAKGLLPINGQWGLFDLVDGTVTIESCDEAPQAKIVVIGRNLQCQALEESLKRHDALFLEETSTTTS